MRSISGSSTALPSRHLLAEYPHNRLWVTVNDGQQDAGGAIWNTASLFPFLHGTRVETESVRKFLATQLHVAPHCRGPGPTAGTPRPHQPARLPPRRHPRPALAHGVAHRLPGRRRTDPLPPRLSPHRRPQPDPRERPRAGRHAPDRAQEPRHLRPLQHHPRAGTARRRGPTGRLSGAAGATGAGGASPPAAPPGRPCAPRAPPRPFASCDAPPRKGTPYAREPGGGGRTPPVCAPQVESRPRVRAGQRSWHTWQRGGPTRPNTDTRRTRPSLQARRPGGPDALLGDMQSDRLGGGSPSQRR